MTADGDLLQFLRDEIEKLKIEAADSGSDVSGWFSPELAIAELEVIGNSNSNEADR